MAQYNEFQSMLPVRGATQCFQNSCPIQRNFNPCSPCGERPMASNPLRQRIIFQSTLPVRGATGFVHLLEVGKNISIHAPRAGSDQNRSTGLLQPG